MADESTIEISAERIERLINAMSLLSLGEYEAGLAQIELTGKEDRMGVLEQALQIFVEELAEAREDNARYVAQVEESKQEIEQKLETIERQQLAIRDLSTPIIELWDDILTLPIVGLVDTQRSIEMTEQLLNRIAESNARCVIIDVTGIDVIDTMTANHFMEMIRAARLLGAYCVVTGMSPHTAQTMVNIGIDLGSIRTLRSLKEGLKRCLHHLHADDARPRSGES